MKIIFLDIDGVVNVPPYDDFNKDCLEWLYYILENTGAKIVVSSSWRCGDVQETRDSFLKHGFSPDYLDTIVGETCRGYKNVIKGSKLPIVRGNEIKAWVDTMLKYPWHGDPSKDEQFREYNEDGSFRMMRSNKVEEDYAYVILDDDTDMLLEQANYFINTDPTKGLTREDAEKAIKILNRIP